MLLPLLSAVLWGGEWAKGRRGLGEWVRAGQQLELLSLPSFLGF